MRGTSARGAPWRREGAAAPALSPTLMTPSRHRPRVSWFHRDRSAPPDPPLRCPRDGAEMDKVQQEDVTFDRCPQCRGSWFDKGELSHLVHRDVDGVVVPELSGFACPRCRGLVARLRVGRVLADECQDCRGVWLDAGEVDAARSADGSTRHGFSLASLLDEEGW